jgi:hypothetical protein
LNYESPALTAELQAHVNYGVKHNTSPVSNPESISGAALTAELQARFL